MSVSVGHNHSSSPRASSLGNALSYVLLLLPESIRDPLPETEAGTFNLQTLLLGTELAHSRCNAARKIFKHPSLKLKWNSPLRDSMPSLLDFEEAQSSISVLFPCPDSFRQTASPPAANLRSHLLWWSEGGWYVLRAVMAPVLNLQIAL